MTKDKLQRGIGLDVGTMNLVSARRTSGKKVETRRVRDAFLDLDASAEKMLKLSGVNYIKRDEEIVIIGDAAMETANIFGREARRPMAQGLISAGEIDALEILAVMVKNVLGAPREENEVCFFSVPAAPVDDPSRDVIYHQGVFERIVEECGYEAFPSNEAMAIIFAETASEGFSGLAISFGSGMVNVALAINTIEGMSFSLARSGDWIAARAAKAVGTTQARMCALKEKGINLMDPKGREEEALALYYKSLIDYCLKNIAAEFKKIEGRFVLPKAIPLVVSGGTSMAGGFLEFFTHVFEKKRKRFPIEISEVRQAAEPLNSVAHGLLLQANQEYAE